MRQPAAPLTPSRPAPPRGNRPIRDHPDLENLNRALISRRPWSEIVETWGSGTRPPSWRVRKGKPDPDWTQHQFSVQGIQNYYRTHLAPEVAIARKSQGDAARKALAHLSDELISELREGLKISRPRESKNLAVEAPIHQGYIGQGIRLVESLSTLYQIDGDLELRQQQLQMGVAGAGNSPGSVVVDIRQCIGLPRSPLVEGPRLEVAEGRFLEAPEQPALTGIAQDSTPDPDEDLLEEPGVGY